MNEFDWFLSILEKQDMATIASRFNVQIQGFDKNIQNAPVIRLRNAIKEYLNNGLLRKKKRALNYQQMLNTIADELNLKSNTLEEFIMQIELDNEIRPYQAFAYLYINFQKIFEEKKDLLKGNMENNDFIFKGLIEERTTKDKIQSLINTQLGKDEIYRNLKSYENLLEKGELKNDYYLFREKIKGDVEILFKELIKCPKEKLLLVLFAFIIENENYINPEYYYILKEVKYSFENLKYKREASEKEKIIENNKMLQLENDELITYKNRFISLKEDNDNLKIKISLLQSNIKLLEEEQNTLKLASKNSEILSTLINNLIKEKNFLIITSEIAEFKNTPLDVYVREIKDFTEDKKIKNLQPYRDKILFFTRVSFETREWGKIKIYLEKNKLKYYELGHFDIASYMAEIIQFIYREELEYEFEY
ncbi:hypothetical protein CD30_08960 [Ureibacillus massiliensis 4400831 = CIP 108448 = CCUG 49529]|uniref:Uncharacterized protein n=1 Tax=Ureibacillus massiliensis 4400831 = CIP 108448 = CCUG 49529 TaxID=1211035 RepID=A0A0A3JV23_9BACL|nr:hypothetical protein [Ureibacillus massiliensis]KGR90837.1 hypothetical protein CD30_08960 [Ureibacillus massiliensis 4400831 = CIP 108448 = CCUG 49529]